MIEDYYSREQSGCDTEGDKIAHGELHLLHARSALAARVAAALHGERQLICAAERRDKQRNQYRYERLGALYKSACFKIRSARFLRVHYALDLLDKHGDKAQGERHYHGEYAPALLSLSKARADAPKRR